MSAGMSYGEREELRRRIDEAARARFRTPDPEAVLRSLLSDGRSRPRAAVYAAAVRQGVKWPTLVRAASRVGVVIVNKRRASERWYLPPDREAA
jgi:hypothetical protein